MGKNFLIILLIFFALAFISYKKFHNVQGHIEIVGNEVTLDYGSSYLKATMDPETKKSFLVNVAFNSESSDGRLNAMSMDEARQLKVQYKDFVHCDSPGASAAQEILHDVFLFTPNPDVKKEIKDLFKRPPNTVVEMTAANLNITERRHNSEPYIDASGQQREYYLVSDLQVVQEKYE